MTPQYKAMMKKLRSNTVKETTQATRNIRKFKKHQTHGIKGRMITDDYGNRYSVTNDPKAIVARRHTLSRAKKRAITAEPKNAIQNDRNFSNRTLGRHYASRKRREKLTNTATFKGSAKLNYHATRSRGELKTATNAASNIHYGKRKHKDFTK